MIEIEREDLETLLQLAFENWQMSESEWSAEPDADDLAFLLKIANLSGNPVYITEANDKINSSIKYLDRDIAMMQSIRESSGVDQATNECRLSASIAQAQERMDQFKAITSHTPSAAAPDAP